MERIPEEVIEAYEKSDAYQALLEQRREVYDQLVKYYQKYSTKEEYFKNEMEKKADHESYAKGGRLLHRGILCNGNIEALIIGNVTRGRAVKKKENADYIYRYDENNKLISCIKVGNNVPDTLEYIIWEKERIQIGLTYGQFGELEFIAEARYNEEGRLLRYSYSDFSDGKPFAFLSEKYEYQGRKIFVSFIDVINQSVEGVHIVLYTNDEGEVLKYTRCTDMNQDEVYEEIPKYKLVI